MPHDESMIQDLIEWAHVHQSSLHTNVEVYQDPLTGLSFRATANLSAATKIANCSYQVTLSYLNAIPASSAFHQSVPFPLQFIEALKQDDPNIIGHFFLVQQFLMGENSFWWHYIKLLPQPDEPERLAIPIWWHEADRRFLDGTNAEPPIKKREELWKKEWTKGVAHLREGLEKWDEYTYPLYQWAATIFGSRSFRASLTVAEEFMINSHISRDDLSLTLDHIKNDRFSVLLPLMDIGNHNGIKQVDWLLDSIAGQFSLSIRDAIPEGSQIFNYYGEKSNSELLVAYGYVLPNPENDKVNLKLTPTPAAMQVRRSQLCHVIHAQPEQEFMFHVKRSKEKTGIQTILDYFSEGLIDTLICMVANARERNFIIKSPEYCIEKARDPLGGPLSKSFIQALSILCEKLECEKERIETSGAKLGEPQNQNQRLALDYRQGQLQVLKEALASVSEYVQQSISFNCICLHAKTMAEANDKANFISLECAFACLQKDFSGEYHGVMKIIAEDQEEPLPLDWSIIVEEWDHTYWIVWIMLVCMLWDRDGEDFELRCPDHLWGWQSGWFSAFHFERKKAGSRLTETLRADASEEATIDQTIQSILQLPQFQSVVSLRNMKYRTELRNYISCIVQEETVLLPYKMQHSSQKGTLTPQKMLFISHHYSVERPT